MKNRVIRLALGAGLALVATAPLSGSAHAMKCTEPVSYVCSTYGYVCQYVPEGQKVNPHDLLCTTIY